MWLMLLDFPNGVGGWANIAKVEVVSSNLISRSKMAIAAPLCGAVFGCGASPRSVGHAESGLSAERSRQLRDIPAFCLLNLRRFFIFFFGPMKSRRLAPHAGDFQSAEFWRSEMRRSFLLMCVVVLGLVPLTGGCSDSPPAGTGGSGGTAGTGGSGGTAGTGGSGGTAGIGGSGGTAGTGGSGGTAGSGGMAGTGGSGGTAGTGGSGGMGGTGGSTSGCSSNNDCENELEVCVAGTCVAGTEVFVTSTTSNGDLGNIAGADTTCRSLAGSAGLRGVGWHAWISVAVGNPSSFFPHQTIPYHLVDGTKIADDWADLTDGDLAHAINRDESGALVSGSDVWTGTTSAGTGTSSRCGGSFEQATGAVDGTVGSTANKGLEWTARASQSCNTSSRIYCFKWSPAL